MKEGADMEVEKRDKRNKRRNGGNQSKSENMKKAK